MLKYDRGVIWQEEVLLFEHKHLLLIPPLRLLPRIPALGVQSIRWCKMVLALKTCGCVPLSLMLTAASTGKSS